VLIDEIDKADIDFPNDLLDVLDEFVFDVEEMPQQESELCFQNHEQHFRRSVGSKGNIRPIVVITSNREKQLPEPFLRRCLYLELAFPDDSAMLARIVQKNILLDGSELGKELLDIAVKKFIAVREKARAAGADQKLPATSELIDWVRILHWRGIRSEQVADSGDRPPYYELLFKTASDRRKYVGQTE
jgi:MoxR-like ATPase